MDSKTLLRASVIGAAAMAYVALLVFHYEIFSLYTILFAVVGAAVGVLVAYKVKFR